MLQVGVLGEVRARLDGRDLELGGPRQRAVLAMLVAAGPGRLVSTDRFVEDLWSGEPPPKALAALQAYVSRLRRALEPDRPTRQPPTVLRSVAPGYRLDLPSEAVDAWHVEALLERAQRETDLERVATLVDEAERSWHGEPFAAYRDHGWAVAEAERLADLRAGAVELRGQAWLRLGRAAAVVASLGPHVRTHPLRERGVEILAAALYQEGRQGEALETIARLRAALAEELGVDPGPGVRALEADVLAHADHLARPPAAPAPAPDHPAVERPAVPPSDGFVGRTDELARLEVALGAAREAARTRIAWVAGDAGFGKSTLVERFCDERAGAAVVARGRCPEVDGAPAGWPWHEVLGALGAPASTQTGAFALGREVAVALEPYADRQVLVVLEDLHVADDDTLQVLRHLTASFTGPVLVVGTYRAHQVGPGLGLTLAALAETTVERIELGGLGDADAARLLARFGRRTLSASTTADLVSRSAGNPLFLREIGQLVSAEGAASGLALPPVIRDLLTRRLERLPGEVVDLLSRAAVLGDDVDLDLLLAVERERGGLGEEAVVEALDAGLVAGLLDLPTPGALRFTHALIRDTCYQRLPPLRRTRLHQAVVRVLERDRPGALEALAAHAAAGLDARTADRAAAHLEAATAAAAATGAWADAVRHARSALAALDLHGSDPRRLLPLLRALSDGLAGVGDLEAARRARRDAVAHAEAHGTLHDVAHQLAWDVPTVWTVRPLADVEDDLVAQLRDVLDRLEPGEHALRVRLLSTLVLETDSSPLVDVAEQAAAEALDLARELGDPRLLCQALNAAYFVSFPPREESLQARTGRELLEVAAAHGLVAHEAVAHHVLFGAAAGTGDLATAAAHVREALRCGAAGQLPLLLVVAGLFAGVADLVRGDLDGAAAVYTELARQIEASGDSNGDAMRVVLAFTVAHARGDTSGTAPLLEPFVEGGQVHARDLLVRAQLDAGDVGAARATWRDNPAWRDYLWGFFAAVQAENAADLGELEVCARLYAELLPWAGRLAGLTSGSATLGPVDYYLGRLARALGDEDAARRHLADAAALAASLGHAAWQERARR